MENQKDNQITSTQSGSFEGDTIAAISTSTGEAGIGIVRLSGSEAFSITQRLFRPADGRNISQELHRKLRYGWIMDGEKVVDEVLVSFMQHPHTYTAEDVTEINAHGGSLSVRRILALTLQEGARLAERGEFTRRAFLNGRLDLTQAEAVLDVIDAKTEAGQELAIRQLTGTLSRKMEICKDSLLHLLSRVEYAINFMEDAEEDLPLEPVLREGEALLANMQEMLSNSRKGKMLREGVRTAIVGRPNVGKSSLLNALLQEERAIVTEVPGTTRDAIEEMYQLQDVALRLIDTAGIRETDDVVESIGVTISRRHLAESDLILLLLDGSSDFSDEDRRLFDAISDRRAIVLVNKEDLGVTESIRRAERKAKQVHPQIPWVTLSAKEGSGLSDLQDAILSLVFPGESEESEILLSNVRQIDLLTKAKEALSSGLQAIAQGVVLDAAEVDLRLSYGYLAELTGEKVEEDVLNSIFRDFCVGK